jgi:hypothetical protein
MESRSRITRADQGRMRIARVGEKTLQAGFANHLWLLGKHIGLFKDMIAIGAFHSSSG